MSTDAELIAREDLRGQIADMMQDYVSFTDTGCVMRCGDFADAILALPALATALEAARADGEWLPIESAPSDTEVLMYCPHRHASNPERVEAGVYHDTRGGWRHSYATHWRPLPSPPAEEKKT